MSDTFSVFATDVLRRAGDGELCWALFRSLGSTNSFARALAQRGLDAGAGAERVAVLAWEQESGRGRLNRRWACPAGQGVLASLLVTEIERSVLGLLPLLVGTALCESLQALLPSEIRLKWPNDLYVVDSKLGGILVESVSRGSSTAAIIGFGVNYGPALAELEGVKATSIRRQVKNAPELAQVAVTLVEAVLAAVEDPPGADEIVDRARALAHYREGQRVQCTTHAGAVSGAYRGLDDRGFLLIDTGTMIETVAAAEVVGG